MEMKKPCDGSKTVARRIASLAIFYVHTPLKEIVVGRGAVGMGVIPAHFRVTFHGEPEPCAPGHACGMVGNAAYEMRALAYSVVVVDGADVGEFGCCWSSTINEGGTRLRRQQVA